MFLDKVGVGNGALGSYTFTYNPIDLPHRLSYDQDHWGYFNNSSNNDLFTPADYYYNVASNTYVSIPGANKQIDETYAQAAVLQKISYPTGGSTSFTYENNTAYSLPADFDLKYTDKVFFLNGQSYTDTYFEKAFVISEDFLGSGGIFAKLSGSFGCTGTGFSCPDIRLYYPNGTSIQINQASYGKTYFLKKGNYRVTADYSFIPNPQTKIQNFSFVLTWPESFRENPLTAHNVKVGGLRIKQIDNFEPNSSQTFTKRYSYTKFNASNESSGTILSVPYYKYNVLNYNGISAYCQWPCVTAVSNTGLGTTNGNPVGYAQITEYIDKYGVLGKNEYVYAPPVFTQPSNQLPFAPADNRDFFNGMLQNERTYGFKDNAYVLKKEVRNKYALYNPSGSSYGFGLKTTLKNFRSISLLDDFSHDVYNVSTGWMHLDTTETKMYDGGMILTTQVFYTQNAANLLNSKTEQISSRGLINTELIKYPVDYTDGSYGADLLKNKMVNDAVLEKSVFVNNQLVSKEANGYDNFGTLVMPSKISKLSTTDQVMEERLSFINYDNVGNLLSLNNVKGTKTTYLYSYNTQYPIAEIKNADYATVESLLGGATAVNNFSNSNPTDAEVKAFLAPLRTGLPDAQITTFTYKPLVGMTSSTDTKGMTTYYEYDEFQRLKNVKDQNGNFIKSNAYHYKN